MWYRILKWSLRRRNREKRRVTKLTKFCEWMPLPPKKWQGGIIKSEKLHRVTKNRKLWRVMFFYKLMIGKTNKKKKRSTRLELKSLNVAVSPIPVFSSPALLVRGTLWLIALRSSKTSFVIFCLFETFSFSYSLFLITFSQFPSHSVTSLRLSGVIFLLEVKWF